MARKSRNNRVYTEKEKLVLAAGKTPILYRKNDEAELSRVLKNYNAKITRAAKKNPGDSHILPEKLTKAEFKEMVATREDYKRELQYLKDFSKRGAEKVVVIPDTDNNLKTTKWQLETMEDRVDIINRKRKKRRKMIADIDMTDRGKKTGYNKGQLGMGKADEVALRPTKAFSRSMDRTNLNRKFKNLQKESSSMYWSEKEQLLRENYIKSLEENYPAAKVADIVSAIREMPYEDFYKTFQAEGGNFEESYPGDEEAQRKNLNALQARWIPNKIPKGK